MLEAINRDALIITPKKAFIDKLNTIFKDDTIEFSDPLEHDNANIYLLPERDTTEASLKFVKIHFLTFFNEELFAWSTDEDVWAEELTWELFNKWFTVSIQSMVLDTVEDKIIKEEI
jgi:hypothetical protein